MWRIFGWDIQYRYPPVERLNFHLEGEQYVTYNDDDDLETVVQRPSIHQSQFLAWMDANKKYSQAQNLTYEQFPNEFVFKKPKKNWFLRKRGFAIGRLIYVPPSNDEKYYMRILLSLCKGPKGFEDIRIINGVQYKTFKEACYALGLLDDDQEYIDAINEASHWGTGDYLRKLFAVLLLSNSMSQPDHVWNETWQVLTEDVLYRQRSIRHNPSKINHNE